MDPSGIVGTGPIADGVQWPDETVTVRWRGSLPSDGATLRFVWIDAF